MKDGWREHLKPLTKRQEITCYDTEGAMKRMTLFAMYGLGLRTIEDFDNPDNSYSIAEISEIAAAVVEDADKGRNPTTSD